MWAGVSEKAWAPAEAGLCVVSAGWAHLLQQANSRPQLVLHRRSTGAALVEGGSAVRNATCSKKKVTALSSTWRWVSRRRAPAWITVAAGSTARHDLFGCIRRRRGGCGCAKSCGGVWPISDA